MTTTNIEDARAMRRMGLPLNTPVIHKTFSKKYTRLWVRYMDGCIAFAEAVIGHHKRCNKKSLDRVVMAFIELVKINNRCVQLSDNHKWDDGERALLSRIHQNKLWPFLEEFSPALEALQRGEEFECPPMNTWSIWWTH